MKQIVKNALWAIWTMLQDIIKESNVCLLLSLFFGGRFSTFSIFINFSEAPSDVLKSNSHCTYLHGVLVFMWEMQVWAWPATFQNPNFYIFSNTFISHFIFFLACCWFRKKTKWFGEQKAFRNSHSVWQRHPGKSFTNTWAQVLLYLILNCLCYTEHLICRHSDYLPINLIV